MRKLLPLATGLLTLAVILILLLRYPLPFEILEGKALNLCFNLRGAKAPSREISIVSVDAQSIEQFDRWPWPRDLIARLTENICKRNPALAVFDITFSLTEDLEKEKTATDSLARASTYCSQVLFPFYFERETQENVVNILEPPEQIRDIAYANIVASPKAATDAFIRAKRLVLSAEKLTANHHCGGHVHIRVEEDKSTRKEVQVLGYGRYLLPSLEITAVKDYYLLSKNDIYLYPDSGVAVGKLFIPIDENGCSLINYCGKTNTFPYISAKDVIEGKIDSSSIQGKIVLIGLTAPGLSRVSNTPFDKSLPTVEKLATCIDNTLTGQWLKRREEYRVMEILLCCAAGILFSVLASFVGFWAALLNCLLFSLIVLAVLFGFFFKWLTWLKLATLAGLPWVILITVFLVRRQLQRMAPKPIHENKNS